MHNAHRIKKVKRKAYEGVSGAKRRQFCDAYRRVLPAIYSNLHKRCIESLKEGEQISCNKGCFYCCYQHVGVTLADGVVIVDYLYSHEGVLGNFLNSYPEWQMAAADISREVDAECNLAVETGNLGASLRHSDDYFDIQVRCPFLLGSNCSIYEVRPLNCAAHYSTSPCEWCAKGSPEKPVLREMLLDESDMIKLMALPNITPGLFLHRTTLPILVYELLVDGLPAFLRESGADIAFM
jgi:Fe-S-cluster containining protein